MEIDKVLNTEERKNAEKKYQEFAKKNNGEESFSFSSEEYPLWLFVDRIVVKIPHSFLQTHTLMDLPGFESDETAIYDLGTKYLLGMMDLSLDYCNHFAHQKRSTQKCKLLLVLPLPRVTNSAANFAKNFPIPADVLRELADMNLLSRIQVVCTHLDNASLGRSALVGCSYHSNHLVKATGLTGKDPSEPISVELYKPTTYQQLRSAFEDLLKHVFSNDQEDTKSDTSELMRKLLSAVEFFPVMLMVALRLLLRRPNSQNGSQSAFPDKWSRGVETFISAADRRTFKSVKQAVEEIHHLSQVPLITENMVEILCKKLTEECKVLEAGVALN